MKEMQQYCPVCKKETRHVIAFYGSPAGWGCAEHGSATHCLMCQKELPETTKAIMRALGATRAYCEECVRKGAP